jgi:hypothetical protein
MRVNEYGWSLSNVFRCVLYKWNISSCGMPSSEVLWRWSCTTNLGLQCTLLVILSWESIIVIRVWVFFARSTWSIQYPYCYMHVLEINVCKCMNDPKIDKAMPHHPEMKCTETSTCMHKCMKPISRSKLESAIQIYVCSLRATIK